MSAPQVFQAADFGNDVNGVPTLTVVLPSQSPGEQVAVLLMNVGGLDRGTASISVSGTDLLPLAAQAPLLAEEAPSGRLGPDVWTMHEVVRKRNEAVIGDLVARGGLTALAERAVAPVSAAAAAPTTTFCVTPPGGAASRRTAILKRESSTAIFYVDDADLAMYTPYETTPPIASGSTIWDRLADAWESRIYPSDTGLFGPPSDVDGNGKLIVFFSSTLNVQGSGILLGYYSPADVFYSLDASTGCTGTGSNAADMFYMNALGSLVSDRAGSSDPWSADFIVNVLYPSTLAHEFQHLINFNQHCLLRSCSTSKDLEAAWVNEGLSMVAEDEAGYGWHPVAYTTFDGRSLTETDVTSARQYLVRTTNFPASLSLYRGYDRASLTLWEGDPVGNYEGAHSWFRYFTDQLGTGFLTQLAAGDLVDVPNFERSAGMTLAQGLGDFTPAMLLSNEDFSTGAGALDFTTSATFDFTGVDWTPFHAKLRHLDYAALNPGATSTVSLRRNGWNAFLTGAVLPGADPVAITVAAGTVVPQVAFVRFAGTLPR